MWWMILIIFGILLYSKLDDLIKLYKEKEGINTNEQEPFLDEHLVMVEELEAFIHCECLITSPTLIYMAFPSMEIPATILQVADDWLEVETLKKKKTVTLVLPIKEITGISKII